MRRFSSCDFRQRLITLFEIAQNRLSQPVRDVAFMPQKFQFPPCPRPAPDFWPTFNRFDFAFFLLFHILKEQIFQHLKTNVVTYFSKNMRKAQILFALCLLLSAGCSSRPTEAEGRKAVEDQINLLADGRIKLVSFQKTDGEIGVTKNQADMSVESYSLQFLGTIEPLHRCALVPFKNLVGEFWIAEGDDDTLAAFHRTDDAVIMNPGKPNNIDGTVIFEKSEKGWRVNKVIIKCP